ncbi:hypothetical protein ABL839_10325 [Variovorax atrisoli 110B]|nr:hypothetical protein [Variovorax paradoxus]
MRSRFSSRASEYFQINPPAMYAALTCDQLPYASRTCLARPPAKPANSARSM